MRKFLSIIVILMMCLGVKAQTEAVDFHSIDDYEREVHLYDILDEGKFAVLYFFFSDATDGPITDPIVAEAYHYFGDNKEDIYFIGIAPSDDSLSIDYWRDTYGMDFPVINRLTVGHDAHFVANAYGVKFFPTLKLVSPNYEIIIEDLWPFPKSGDELIAELKKKTGVDALSELDVKNMNISPNPASSVLNITSEMSGEAEVNIYDMMGRCVKNVHVSDMSNATININDIEKGLYIVNVNGNKTKLVVE